MNNPQFNLLQSGIRDNKKRGTVGNFLREKIKPNSQLSIVSAYFTIYAFEALKDSLLNIKQLNFLFGEPRFISPSVIQADSLSKHNKQDAYFTDKKGFKIEDDEITLTNKLQQSRIARECEQWIEDHVNIRSIRQSNLCHGKMYHITSDNRESAILGSSNFTVKGLGLSDHNNNNIELNLVVDSDRDRQDLKFWFEEIWQDLSLVKDVKADVIAYLKQLYQDNTPQFIYYKTLYHIFFNFIEGQEKGDRLTQQQHLIDTKIWSFLFDFQKDGVKGAINKLLEYNGCIIADSVGLGKTFEAIAIIKYFELLNYRVLVLCPKKLRENWTIYQAQNNSELNILLEDRLGYTVLSHTDLSRDYGKVGAIDLSNINWGNYDLVVIDESHNFRNNTKGKKDEEGNIIKKSRYERLLKDIIQTGVKTRVLLLSATPVNNDLKDLRNQLYLISEGKEDAFIHTLKIKNLKDTLTNAQRTFTKWAKMKNRQQNQLLESLNSDFFTLLDGLTISRSRKHIEQYYPEVVKQLGGFPERLKPISIYPHIDLAQNFMDYDDIDDEISHYNLSLFKPSSYVLEEFKHHYQGEVIQKNFTQENRENYLIGMMKVNFLKRLESSVHSFQITLERTIDKIKNLEQKIQTYLNSKTNFQFVNKNEQAGSLFYEKNSKTNFQFVEDDELQAGSLCYDDDDLQEAFEVGKVLKFQLAHLDIERWLQDLQKDRKQLNKLYLQAKDVDITRDAKLAELKKLIKAKVNHPTTNKNGQINRKIVIFTAFADTAKYLYQALFEWVTTNLKINLALVTGSNNNQTTFGTNKFEHILTNFAPLAKKRSLMPHLPQTGEIDLLIATDCISEGQNLQDCDYLINYDIHWNPVRIIQRFGRIDRIGSPNKSVQLVNFWATKDLDKYINLKNRVESRMALVDLTATGEDNLLKTDDLKEIIKEDLRYRHEQLKRLQHEVLDLEDFNDSVSLNEFTLDDFRIDLFNYIQQHRQLLENAPLGLYAVVPSSGENNIIKPGVIFCLQQKDDTTGNEQINPLQPYFLVYVRNSQDVRFTFAQPKQILDIYRLLCSNQIKVYEELCYLFNQDTENGYNMTKYNQLLESAVNSITKTFKSRSVKNLFNTGKSGKIPIKSQQVNSGTDFELITWLVIS